MASADLLRREEEFYSSLFDSAKGDGAKSRSQLIERKIELLEDMATKVSNRRSRKWMNDRLLIELVPRLHVEETKGLFAPPPWGEEAPLSAFCRTSVGEWDAFRSIDMDAEDPFQRLLLHGVCEFYNVTSTTTSSVRDGRPWKTTTIKKRQGTGVPSRITLVNFLRMKKNGSH
ncbi:unnamed protein product [Miscanthus lutarioriparius]|uniref:R3H-associated N-terminal domain-containing protein n=1 Tax=Miscanthus lutarioriparius TaxID=422564 RepID=A0A811QGD4_9POAL|nr:unnamed protein product [Miscanthus lutarioriparius]